MTEAGKDEAVIRGTEEWRKCMSDQGLSYTTPDQAIEDPQWDLAEDDIPEREIRTARADARCKHATGLVDGYQAAETKWQQDLIERNRDSSKPWRPPSKPI